jgi:hypothetical protein
MHRIVESFDSRRHDITVTQLRAVVQQSLLKKKAAKASSFHKEVRIQSAAYDPCASLVYSFMRRSFNHPPPEALITTGSMIRSLFIPPSIFAIKTR